LLLACVLLACLVCQGGISGAQTVTPSAACPWLDEHLPIATRVSEILSRMTLEQEISLMQLQPATGVYAGYESYVPPIPSLCMPAIVQEDGPAGVDGGITGVTQLPAPIAVASSFDPNLLRQYGATIGAEMRAKGIDDALAPTLNLVRVPQWGRAFETLGEDPFLTSQLGDADIEGIQSQGVIADAKHYVEYNQETGRLPTTLPGGIVQPGYNDIVSVRTMQETELSVFGSAIREAHVGGIMCAFPAVNGTFNCENEYLLTWVLRHQFHFKGYVRTDNPPPISSDVAAVNAGLDQAHSPAFKATDLLAAVADGSISPNTIQAAAGSILYPMFQMGIFNNPPPTGTVTENVSTPADVGFAQGAAQEGTVLLRDQKHTLPLKLKRLHSIAVIGADANLTPRSAGGGSASVASSSVVPPLAGIEARVSGRATVTYAPGNQPGALPTDPGGLDQAVTAARYSQVAIIFLGRPESEGSDLANLNLSSADGELIRSVSAVNHHTIVVLNTGSPVFMPWINHVKAVIEAWYPGVQDGLAIAHVLFGDVDPGGKLPVTFPSTQAPPLSAAPARWPGIGGQVHYAEHLNIGYRWDEAYRLTPLFPFGFGLSYTQFAFSNLRILPLTPRLPNPNRNPDRVVAVVQARVKNVGKLPGSDVAQLYLGDPPITLEPARQLRGFQRVQLAPHHSTLVTFPLTAQDLAHWKNSINAWAIAPGKYGIHVGDSSALADEPLRGSLKVP
jgi:beta-glucosidase